jgi:hypothetical protein
VHVAIVCSVSNGDLLSRMVQLRMCVTSILLFRLPGKCVKSSAANSIGLHPCDCMAVVSLRSRKTVQKNQMFDIEINLLGHYIRFCDVWRHIFLVGWCAVIV